MPTKFICIDDEGPSKINALLERLRRSSDRLEFVLEHPKPFDAQVQSIVDKLPDGLLLDLRLDHFPSEDGMKVAYRAISLAQELRTRMTEGVSKAFPIVLWSIDANLGKSYKLDSTGHDLFDMVYSKPLVNRNPQQIARELVGLSAGYEMIIDFLKGRKLLFFNLLGLSDADSLVLDARLGDQFRAKQKYPAHEYARYLLRDVIELPGPLVSEDWLSARLGVDRDLSKDWVTLREILRENAGYRGVFGDTWPRWWWFKVEQWWESLQSQPANLRRLGAAERVRAICKSTKLPHLQPAKPIEEGYSDKFWTVCLALDRPLDPVDGVLAERVNALPWQESQYLSLNSVLGRVASAKGLRAHPLERERLKEILSQS